MKDERRERSEEMDIFVECADVHHPSGVQERERREIQGKEVRGARTAKHTLCKPNGHGLTPREKGRTDSNIKGSKGIRMYNDCDQRTNNGRNNMIIVVVEEKGFNKTTLCSLSHKQFL